MKRSHRSRGFALLMSLMLVMIAGAVLASHARMSLTRALEAESAVENLRRRWTTQSLRSTLLPLTDRALSQTAARTRDLDSATPSPHVAHRRPEYRLALELSDMRFEVVFTDEQAKLNINHLLRLTDRSRTRSTVAAVTRDAARTLGRAPTVTLRTESTADGSGADGRVVHLRAFGQVLEDAPPQSLLGREPGRGFASHLTLWGDGRLNLRTAARDVIRHACDRELGPVLVSALLEAAHRHPQRDLASLLRDLDQFSSDEKKHVARYLTDRSVCVGLWIVASTPQRAWYSFAVALLDTEAADASPHSPVTAEPLSVLEW